MRRLLWTQPEWLREVFELRGRKGIDSEGRLLLEGLRVAGAARAAGLAFERVLYAPEFFAGEPCQLLVQALQRDGVPSHCVPKATFSQLSYKGEGIVGVVRYAAPLLDDVLACALVVVLDGLADPGNIGAVIRTANAWGPAGVVVVGTPAKLFHPKALRASMGALFHTPACTAERADLVERLRGRAVVVLSPDGAAPERPPRRDVVFVVGNERHGVHPSWHDVTTARVAIPMRGIVDSLNVATSAAIVLWEAFNDSLTREGAPLPPPHPHAGRCCD
jgi:TrmH family RNA methyltransferase